MPLNERLVHYIWLSLQHELDVAMSSDTDVFHPGVLHETTDLEDWIYFYPMSVQPEGGRVNDFKDAFMFQVSCTAKRAPDKNTNRPHELAALVDARIGKKKFLIKAYGDGEAVLGEMRLSEGEHRYTPYRNLTFAGEGNFATENSNTHTMTVTFHTWIGINGG